MSGFLGFWIDCLIRGATWGNSVFGITEIICAFLWLYRRKEDKEDSRKGREEKVKVFGKWCFLAIFSFSTIVLAPYLKYYEKQKETKTYHEGYDSQMQTNLFLNGQLQGQSNMVNLLQRSLNDNKRDNETALLNLKTDLNEANRQKDAALQRLTFWEANPEKLVQIYTNMFANGLTNFEQLNSALQNFNNSMTNELNEAPFAHPSLGLYINGELIKDVIHVTLKTNRTIFLQVTNTGTISAQHVTVDFVPTMYSTNITAPPNWIAEPELDGKTMWHIVFGDPLAATKILSEPSVEILTNFQSDISAVAVDVYADGTVMRRFQGILTLPKY